MVLQCQGVLAKTQTLQAVMAWRQMHPSELLAPAEEFVYVLGSVPDCKMRLEVLKIHYCMVEDLPKKKADAGRIRQV